MIGGLRGADRRVPVPLPADPVAARELVRAQQRRKRMLARRRRTIAVALMGITVVLVGAGLGRQLWREAVREPVGHQQPDEAAGIPRSAAPMGAAPSDAAAGDAAPGGPPPSKGDGTFGYAKTGGTVAGTTGTLRRFRIAVENGTGQDAEAFAQAVDRVFADPRGWTATGVRLQRVTEKEPADFTVFLAGAETSEKMCAQAGLHTAGFSSCRTTARVIVNLDRWLTSVPDYGAPLADYQAYVLNHEVGHELGLGHEACPGAGRPAPVMQQQTYGLKGCVANAWPFVDGQRYTGPKVP